ncbi:MAG: ADP-ribosylglycohydrolase family protein [Desulfomonilaceae bacterium]
MSGVTRYRGCLFGLAVGDAVGATVEFSPPGSFEPVADMEGGGPFDLQPGEWTDDTAMALCLADSLIEKNGFDPTDQLDRYIRWHREGYLSSNGACFDVGRTVYRALSRFEKTQEPYCGGTDLRSAGNGSIMRLAPVPLFYAKSPREAMERSADSSRTTHCLQVCIDACRYLGGLIVGTVQGVSKEELLSELYSPATGYWSEKPLIRDIEEIARGSFKRKEPPEIEGSGYVVKSLEAALWAFYKTDSFKEGCLRAVNLGNDADTTAAVYGQIAGAYYVEKDIPSSWLNKLANRELIRTFADKLFELSRATSRDEGAELEA